MIPSLRLPPSCALRTMLRVHGRQHGRVLSLCRASSSPSPSPSVTTAAAASPRVSDRVTVTDAPCIVKTKKLMAGKPDVMSLAQGVVHWAPPPSALAAAQDALSRGGPSVHGYGPCDGTDDLRDALRAKVVSRNGLEGYDVMVTAGANQAFTNVVLALLDPSDSVVLFKPYYFNHLMAIQMTGGGDKVIFGPCDPATLHPDLDWLERTLLQPPAGASSSSSSSISSSSSHRKPKMVVLTNPCNPTGVLMSAEEVCRAAELCGRAGVWLVLDNTYEDFVYDGRVHSCAAGPHVINLFSFSKAYGMMGWRVGYIAYPVAGSGGSLGSQLLKVQDTIPICVSGLSQAVALGALSGGAAHVANNIAALSPNKAALLDALSPLGSPGGLGSVAGGEGAIYFFAKLPSGRTDDEAVVEWLVNEHGVCLIPGSSCGAPGYVRAAFANLTPERCQLAAGRLKAGLKQLVEVAPGGPLPRSSAAGRL